MIDSRNNRISRRRFLGSAGVMAAGAFLAACGAPAIAPTGPAAKTDSGAATKTDSATSKQIATVTVGHLVGACMSPLFLAHAKGFFKDQSIEVKLQLFGSAGDNLTSLVAGATQVAHNPFSNTLVGKEKGEDLVIVAGSGSYNLEVVARDGVGVRTIDDLVSKKGTGFKIGTARVNTQELTLYHLLKSKGLSYNDFEIVFFNDNIALGQALINKNLDAATVVQPYAAKVVQEAQGIYLGNNGDAWGPQAPDCVVTMKREFVKQQPDVVARYIKAILTANDYMTKNFDDSAKTLAEGRYYKVEGDALIEGLRRSPPQVRLTPEALTALEKGVGDMRDLGYIKSATSESVLDLSILKQVA